MKKVPFIIFILSCCLFLSISQAAASTFTSQTIANPMKDWTITFNAPIKSSSSYEEHIYISSPSGTKHPISYKLSSDSKKLIVTPSAPYSISTAYSLIVKQGVESVKGKKLKTDVTQDFKLQGEMIQSVQAVLNPLATNVKVQGTKGTATMTAALNEGAETALHVNSNYLFTHGFIGIAAGDQFHIRAYNEQGKLLEEQIYRVEN